MGYFTKKIYAKKASFFYRGLYVLSQDFVSKTH